LKEVVVIVVAAVPYSFAATTTVNLKLFSWELFIQKLPQYPLFSTSQ
jgi:hypothetical protein